MFNQQLVISDNNPFRDDVKKMMDNSRPKNKHYDMVTDVKKDGTLISETMTVIVRKEYVPGSFVKVYQKGLISNLQPNAAVVFLHIADNMNYESETFYMPVTAFWLDRRKVYNGIQELVGKRVIAKVDGKRELYWVNLTLVVMGRNPTLPAVKPSDKDGRPMDVMDIWE